MIILPKNVLLAIWLNTTMLVTVLLIHVRSQPGTISIDCGISTSSSYTDETTGRSYVSDTNFTTIGENKDVSPEYKLKTNIAQFWNVRSFPDGIRNCYTLKPPQGNDTRYLVRARFMYGNYDNKNRVPQFDLYLGVDLWDTIRIEAAETLVDKEAILVPSLQSIEVCLVNTEFGVPFISALELRPIGAEIYASPVGKSLQLFQRYDFGTKNIDPGGTRYKEDNYDRIWYPYKKDSNWTLMTNSLRLQNNIGIDNFEVPLPVLSTAYSSTSNLGFDWRPDNGNGSYYFYMHFAELEDVSGNQYRNFDIYVNDNLWNPVPILLDQNFNRLMATVFSRTPGQSITPDGQGLLRVWINATKNSTLPPLINAMEIFMVKDMSLQTTDKNDAKAMMNIKSVYGVDRNWQGDPCSPSQYLWKGLNCSYGADNPRRIISLDLSSSGLKGEISQDIGDLKMLQYLDLSNNSLYGKVPEVLGQLPSLTILNLQGNNFTGPIPESLLNKRSKKTLSMSFDKSLDRCTTNSTYCDKKKNNNKTAIPVTSVVGFFILLALASTIIWWRRRRSQVNAKDPNGRKGFIYSKKHHFKYSDIKRMTNNFERVLGEGAFGTVYHGYLNSAEVAVKILSSKSNQGHREFHAELKLLLTVHHRNLTTLVGYCDDGANTALIYEYMAKGNLRSHLSGKSNTILGWEERLRIAIDTAQGLEYLHSGCKPPIVHRDVKATNILLTEKFQAKLGDFGLSKIFPNELHNDDRFLAGDVPGVSTAIAGTPGYLDPEYCASNWLNEKSDVYSYGVVLLEIITGQPVISRTREHVHIAHWVNSFVEMGDIEQIIDPRIQGAYDVNTAWKVVELALACASFSSNDRPTMNRVAIELKDCLVTKVSTPKDFSEEVSRDFSSVEIVSGNMISGFSPRAR